MDLAIYKKGADGKYPPEDYITISASKVDTTGPGSMSVMGGGSVVLDISISVTSGEVQNKAASLKCREKECSGNETELLKQKIQDLLVVTVGGEVARRQAAEQAIRGAKSKEQAASGKMEADKLKNF